MSSLSRLLSMLIVLCMIAACNPAPSISTPAPTSLPPFSVSVSNVKEGDKAYKEIAVEAIDGTIPMEAERGWKYISFDLIVENNGYTEQGKLTDSFTPSFVATVIDSAEHDREVFFNDRDDTRKILTRNSVILVPHVRYVFHLYTLLPIKNDPQTLQVSWDGAFGSLQADFATPGDTLKLPADDLPARDNQQVTLELNGQFSLTYSDFYFKPNEFYPEDVVMYAKADLENQGEENLNLGEGDAPIFVGVDNYGKYWGAESATVLNNTPPGYKDEDIDTHIFVLGEPGRDFDWLLVTVITPQGQVLGQFIADPSKSTIPNPDPDDESNMPGA